MKRIVIALALALVSCNSGTDPEYQMMHNKRMLDLEYYKAKIEIMNDLELAEARLWMEEMELELKNTEL